MTTQKELLREDTELPNVSISVHTERTKLSHHLQGGCVSKAFSHPMDRAPTKASSLSRGSPMGLKQKGDSGYTSE